MPLTHNDFTYSLSLFIHIRYGLLCTLYRVRMVFRDKRVHVAKRVVKVMPDRLENVVEKVIGVIKVNKVN